MSLTIGSLFSGIGGLELGLERAGLGPVLWQVEKEPYCREVLARHWPKATRYEDICWISRLAPVGLICGGFPCQDVSQAARGRNEGLDGEHSGLWRHFARITERISPQFVVVENVSSGKARWLPTVRRDLHMLGYDSSAIEISASDVGAPHIRKRIFVVANAYANSKSVGAIDAETPVLSSHAGTMWNGWTSEPISLRMDDGVSRGLDRVRALGNAVVPQCAEVIGRIILSMRKEAA